MYQSPNYSHEGRVDYRNLRQMGPIGCVHPDKTTLTRVGNRIGCSKGHRKVAHGTQELFVCLKWPIVCPRNLWHKLTAFVGDRSGGRGLKVL